LDFFFKKIMIDVVFLQKAIIPKKNTNNIFKIETYYVPKIKTTKAIKQSTFKASERPET